MAEWVIGTVKNIKFWNNRLFSLIIHAPICPFEAGQFTKLALEINGKHIQRAYSYVNAPNDPNLEFYLVVVKEGRLSPKLAKIHVNENIKIVKKASGFFTINEIPNCETLWMLSTGTALGPYLSILRYGKNLERFKNIVLVHAVRYAVDLNYHSEMLSLKKTYKGKLHIQTIVSREKVVDSLTGRIPSLIESGELEKTIGLTINANNSHVMLCGNPNMVHDTQELLEKTRHMIKNLRHIPGHITYEHYW